MNFDMIKTIETTLDTTIINGVEKLTEPAIILLGLLGTISILVKWERYFTGQPFWGELAVKGIQIGFLAWLIKHWFSFYITFFKDSAESIGAMAAGQTEATTISGFLSKYVSDIFKVLSNATASFAILDKGILLWILCGIILLVSIYMLVRIAITMFMAKYELAIVGGLLVILLPLSVLDYTKEFGNKVWSSLFAMFVKLMIVSFFFYLICTMGKDLSLVNTSIKEGAKIDAIKAEIPKLISYVISLGFLMYLMNSATSIAQSLISGATISSGNPMDTAGRGVAAMAGGVAGAATRTVGAVAGRATLRNAASAGRTVASGVASGVAGAASRVRSLFN